MPQPSAFTWFGAIDFSGNPTHIETLYELLPTLWGSEIDFTVIGSDDELQLYATAVVLGSALYESEKAGNQANPLSAYDLLPLLEQDYGLTPGPNDGVIARQNALAEAMRLPTGAGPASVVNILKVAAGKGNFIAYVPSPTAPTPTVYPVSPGAGPGQFRDIRVAPRFLQLVDPVVTPGSAWCAYQNIDPTITTPELLLKGDSIVVGAGNTSQMENVTVTAVWTPTYSSSILSLPPANVTPGYNYFKATFANSHDVGAPIVTGSFPYWWSTQRLALVVVNAATASSRKMRAILDAKLARTLRTVDTWAIVAPTTQTGVTGTVGPLTLGSPMGTQTIGSIPFTQSM